MVGVVLSTSSSSAASSSDSRPYLSGSWLSSPDTPLSSEGSVPPEIASILFLVSEVSGRAVGVRFAGVPLPCIWAGGSVPGGAQREDAPDWEGVAATAIVVEVVAGRLAPAAAEKYDLLLFTFPRVSIYC